ncbi:MAG: hypothetical protein B6242_00655 [Anaerolineaceae bacterium 4572_78]|nr:MAG: hypothetical protein B6242_00655 [Anaerolineaceae bacterium 4572_78]
MNTLTIYRELESVMDGDAAIKIAEMLGRIHDDLKNTVTKFEFRALATDTAELKGIVRELAEAQKRTEFRVEELAEAQKRTELRLDNLTVKVEDLVKEHAKTRTIIGDLTDTIGYTLENSAYKALPKLLKQDYDIVLTSKMIRTYLIDNRGYELEVNIFARGEQHGQPIVIMGESKSRLSHNKIDSFFKKRIERFEGIYANIFPVFVTHIVSSSNVAQYAKEKGLALYYSYQFD